ncbi:MAG: sigma-70 family RNA polymerase sigma factor [Planctomycetota bacterium]
MNTDQNRFDLSELEFVALLVKHEPSLRAFARALVQDWDLVDEALQDASITIWAKRDQLQSQEGFLPWARTILRFKCMRQLERLRSRRPALSDQMLEALAVREDERPADLITARRKALRVCLSQFSSEHRELLLAPHSPTYSVVELAEQRQKTTNALYKRLARLRSQLSECIGRRIATEAS